MRREPPLAETYRKDAGEEQFLAHLNAILSPHQEQEYRPLPERFPALHIIGAPRSGTTLLSQLVANHLDIGYINNLIAAFWRAPVYGIRLSKKLLRREQSTPNYDSQYGRTVGLHAPHEFGYFWSSMLKYPDFVQRGPEHEKTIDWQRLGLVLTNMADAFDSPVMFKSLLLGWHLERMVKTLPRTCFIRIRRDAVDNALSIVKMRQEYGGSVDRWVSLKPRECEGLEKEAYWVQAAAQVHFLEQSMSEQIARLPATQVLEVHYDQLCAEPRDVLDQIQALLQRNGAAVERLSNPPPKFDRRRNGESSSELVDPIRSELNRLTSITRSAA